MTQPPVCGTCPCYVRDGQQLKQGTCHADRPQVLSVTGTDPMGRPAVQIMSVWKTVSTDSAGCPDHPAWPQYRQRFLMSLNETANGAGERTVHLKNG